MVGQLLCEEDHLLASDTINREEGEDHSWHNREAVLAPLHVSLVDVHMSFRDFLVGLEGTTAMAAANNNRNVVDHDNVPDDLFDELASLIQDCQHNNNNNNNNSTTCSSTSSGSVASPTTCTSSGPSCATSGSSISVQSSSSRRRGVGPTSGPSAHHVLSSLMPKELLGSMVVDALDCFMFLVTVEGRIELISEGVSDILGVRQRDMMGVSLYDLIHAGDHARFSLSLMLADNNEYNKNDESLAAARVFNCRFRSRRINDSIVYETMQVSALPMKNNNSNSNGSNTSNNNSLSGSLAHCRLFCLARRVSSRERNQYFPVEPFTTKLDPASNFVVTAVDTTGMNAQNVATFMQSSLLHKSIIEAIHDDDRGAFQRHLQACIREGEHVSPVVRMQAGKDEFMHVQTKSKLFKACPQMGTQRAFIMATHSLIGQTEIVANNNNNIDSDSKGNTQSNTSAVSGTKDVGKGVRRNSGGDTECLNAESEAKEKNLLLKQLLNITSSRSDLSSTSSVNNDGSQLNNNGRQSGTTSNRILQLLSGADHNVQRSSSQIKGVKRSSSGSITSPISPKQSCLSPRSSENSSPSVDATSNVCQQNPSLTSLLSKPSNSAIAAVPPPVPTKWHQEPREKLPKSEDNLKKFLPPHPAERGRFSSASLDHAPSPPPSTTLIALSTTTTPITLSTKNVTLTPLNRSGSVTSHARTRASSSPAAAPIISGSLASSHPSSSSCSNHVFDTLGVTDTELNDILEGVIDIQERSLASTGLTTSTAKASELIEIERYLASNETANELRNLSSSSSSLIQSVAGGKRGVMSVASNATRQVLIAGVNNSNAGNTLSPVSLVPRINELLQEVPPNVSVPQQTPELSLVLMQQQQQQQQRRRHMSSGSSGSIVGGGLPSNISSGLLPSNAQQHDLALRLQQQQHQHRLTHSQSLPNNNRLSQILPQTTLNNKQRNAAPSFSSQLYRQTSRMPIIRQQQQHVHQPRIQSSLLVSTLHGSRAPQLPASVLPTSGSSVVHLLPAPNYQSQEQQQETSKSDQTSRSLLQKLLSD